MSFVDTTNSISPDTTVIERAKEFLSDNYDEEVQKFPETKDNAFYIDWEVIRKNDQAFAKGLNDEPEDYYYQLELAVREYSPDIEGLEDAELRLENHDKTIQVRNLRSKSVNEMVSIEGIVSKATGVKPRLSRVVFSCPACGAEHIIVQSEEELKTPGYCPDCGDVKLNQEHIDYSTTDMIDFQKIQIQEPPEDVSGGDNPQSIDVNIVGNITGEVTPGERVTATGILKGKLASAGNRKKKSIMGTYLKGVNIQKEEQDYEELNTEERDKELIKQYSEDEDIYEKLANSIAPSIYGYEQEKEALVLQLFSGVTKHVDDGNTRLRGDLHILFVGDPGTGKSQIVRYVEQLSPRGVYTSGKGSSAAGLTASAVRDSDFGGDDNWTLQAGALVLADKGVACVDELDKMRKQDRSALHEALEQQTISVNKAGINATLKSRCSLLAAANPEEGRFDEHYTVPEQINLDPPLVSRFDLIFTVQDRPEKSLDGRIASHILETNRAGQRNASTGKKIAQEDPELNAASQVIETDIFRKYVAHARKNVTPELSDDAQEKIHNFYVDLREEGKNNNNTISITARKLESLIRLSEASARIRLSDTVEAEDANRAIKITLRSLKDVGMDPETNEFDMDMLETGSSKTQRKRKRNLKNIIQDLSKESKENDGKAVAKREDIIKTAEKLGMDIARLKKEIDKMHEKGRLLEASTHEYRLVD